MNQDECLINIKVTLARIDERVANLQKSMDNHLQHHDILEKSIEERLDRQTGRFIGKIWRH
jgi:hypothetical protein